jgi:hypothetical protein
MAFKREKKSNPNNWENAKMKTNETYDNCLDDYTLKRDEFWQFCFSCVFIVFT